MNKVFETILLKRLVKFWKTIFFYKYQFAFENNTQETMPLLIRMNLFLSKAIEVTRFAVYVQYFWILLNRLMC